MVLPPILLGSASAITFTGATVAEVTSAVTHGTAEPAQLLVCGAALLVLSVALSARVAETQEGGKLALADYDQIAGKTDAAIAMPRQLEARQDKSDRGGVSRRDWRAFREAGISTVEGDRR